MKRPPVAAGRPVHVGLRVREDVPNLRAGTFVRELRASLAQACERGDFRVVHYSIQKNHAHFLVEAAGKEALGRGMRSLAARFARAANRAFCRRGPVLFGRYWMRVLRTPREVRNALDYVLQNAWKHLDEAAGLRPRRRVLDRASSARWFDGWKGGVGPPPEGVREVARARTWLLTSGWRRHGLIAAVGAT